LRELTLLREEGLVRQVGLTNFDTAHLRVVLASGIPVVSNQVTPPLSTHPFDYPLSSSFFSLHSSQGFRLTNLDTAECLQVCYSLLDNRAGGAMAALCKEHGVGLLAYGTLGGGFLTDAFLGVAEPPPPKDWSQMKYQRFLDQVRSRLSIVNLSRVTKGVLLSSGESIIGTRPSAYISD
jgi:aryl-alcohol dehydrogenase-like predicted oxidoreductase